ncbi:Laccase [Phytophthora citrophthora]|uniref:Laccase n=1 Tax=Phytophthora citrophthora TaxID=4793 RepID=A0AAD9G0E7_9STRA|nr:Laccase [Phytophthora citrophthora]
MGRSQRCAVLFTFLLNQLPLSYAGDVVTYNWRLTPIKSAFDGVLLDTLGVNDKPCDEAVIEVELGQEVEVRVTNELYEATCLHWHGMKQLGTQEMDGVSGFTQCFIESNTTAVYRFKPDKAGTFWWHSHHKTQYAFGLRGPLIVHAPESELRDCEKEIEQEYTVQLADIYHALPPPGPALWDTIVINNRGRFDCNAAAMNNLTDCSPVQPLSTFLFEGGKKYLLRLISLAAMAPFEFSIDDHDFQVIAADSEPVVPTEPINSIFINAGQRYDILIEAKNDTQGLDSFWMRAKGLTGLPWMVRTSDTGLPGFNDEGLAIIRYNPASTSEPTTQKCEEIVTINEFDFTPAVVSVLPTTPADRSIVQFNISAAGGVISLDGGEYHSLMIPNVPPLLSISNGSTTADLPATANARALEYGKHVEVVLVNDMIEQHPFHLHSHAPWVVASGQATAEDIFSNNLPPSKLVGAMLRDVYTVPPCETDENNYCINVGYVILRFTADNPGVWMMHCHIDWHMDIGLSMIYVEGEKELQEKGPDAFSSSLLSVCKRHTE